MLVNKVDIAMGASFVARTRQAESSGVAVQRRLIIRPGAIGDFIVSLPALESLAAPYTEVWTAEVNLPLVRFADCKRSIISSGLDRVGVMDAGDVIARLRRFDSIVSWYGANRPEFRELVAAAGLPFEFHQALPTAAEGVHAVDYYCAQVGFPPGAVPRIDVGELARHGNVVVHPFASARAKEWPYALEFHPPGIEVVRIRGPENELEGAIFIPDLFELGRFLAGARTYVGNDSGITHLAAAAGAPTVALFGPTDPAVWAPRGEHVRVIHAPSMGEIGVRDVIALLDKITAPQGKLFCDRL
jgi:heptosyltransferase-3